MKPLFEIPENKLVDLSSLKEKTKPLKEVLRIQNKAVVNRKDFDANWDAVFWSNDYISYWPIFNKVNQGKCHKYYCVKPYGNLMLRALFGTTY